MPYAENTSVPATRSRAEIEETLQRYGADSFGYMSEKAGTTIGFKFKNRLIRISVPAPDASHLEITKYRRTRAAKDDEKAGWVEAEYRRRWRALALVIKAKLEAVDSGIALFEDEFLAYTVSHKDGRTVGDILRPQLDAISTGNRMPLLPSGD